MKKEYLILHVIDDEKFVPYCRETFAVKGFNNNYCSSDAFHQSFSRQYHLIVIHGLNFKKAKVLLTLNDLPKVVWFMWGADAFCFGKFYNKFLLSGSKKLRIKLAFKENVNFGFKTLIKTLKPSLIDKEEHYSILIKALLKIDVIVPVVPGDYDLLRGSYNINATMCHLSYVNPIFKQEIKIPSEQNNILIGNSASLTSNHYEVIKKIGELDLGSRRVIIPLNYGNEAYGDYITAYAKKKLSNVKCLRDFLPFEAYKKTLSTCGVVIMNHTRQQAVGNIVQALMHGSHLYLNEKSSVYQYLKNEKFIISDIKDLAKLRNLNEQEKKYNKEKCLVVFGKKAQHQKVIELVKGIDKNQVSTCL